jgi:hypothetical protein
MTLSDFRRITDELLSAYIDGEVTEQERAFIETAIAQDEEIAWRVNSLRQTVTLLRDLPELTLPRSFALTLDQALMAQPDAQIVQADAMKQPALTPAAPVHPRRKLPQTPSPEHGFWAQIATGWRSFWQGGSPMLRNAAAVSFALMILLASGGPILTRALTQSTGSMAAAPTSSETSTPAEAVALAPTATVATATESSGTESSGTGPISAKSPAAEATAESATVSTSAPQAQAEATSEAPAAESASAVQAQAAPNQESTENEVTASGAAETDTAAQAGEATLAEASPADGETAEEPAAAMAVPAEPQAAQSSAMPPMVANTLPDGRGGDGLGAGGAGGMGAGGGGAEGPMAPGAAGQEGLVPPGVYGFDVNPAGAPTSPSADSAVVASIAAAPTEAAPAESVANVAVTPAVEVPAPLAAAAAAASEPAETAMPAADNNGTAARSAVPVTETVTASITESAATTEQAPEQAEQAIVEATVEPTPEPTLEPTPTAAAVALVAPEGITSSAVVENVKTDDAVPANSPSANLPILWIAQGSTFLLTIVLASLWWRSRNPRRPRKG